MITPHNKNPWHIILPGVLCMIAISTCIFFSLSASSIKSAPKNNPILLSNNSMAIDKNVNIGLPTRLKIPVINVDAVIYYVGLNSDGAMDIKKDPTKVGWYEFGPRPGQNGNAVIAGHYGWLGDKGSVFNDLHTLKKGDEVIVTDNNELQITFIVRDIQILDPDSNASKVFNSNDNNAHLNLITCNGTWENSKQSYSNRLVVFTDKKID